MARDLPTSARRHILRVHLTMTPRATLIAGVVLLLLIAAVARLLTFEQYMPYLNSRLEGNMFLLTLGWRGLGDSTIYGASVPVTARWLSGYPPLFVWINMVFQVAVEAFSTRPWLLITDYVYPLRLAAVVYGIITTGLVASIGWQLAGRLAGWLSGILWALSPILLAENSLGIPDPIVYMMTAASITMALRAWTLRSPRRAFASLIAAIVVIYTKYPAFVVLIPWGIATLVLIRHKGRALLRWLVVEALLAGISAAYLLIGHHALSLSNGEGRTVQQQGLSLMLDLSRNYNNWGLVVLPIGAALLIATLVAGALAYLYSRQHGGRTTPLDRITVLLIYCAAGVMVTASFIEADLSDLRHTLPITLAIIPVWGAAVNQIVWALDAWSQRGGRQRWRTIVLARLPLGIAAVATIILGSGAVQLAAQYRVTHTVEQLWRWADGYLPNDGVILMHPDSYLQTVWNRPYSGYDGSTPFAWVFDKNPGKNTPESLAAQGVSYLMFTEEDRVRRYHEAGTQALIDQLMFLKQIPPVPDPSQQGPTIYVFRIQPPQYAMQAEFGEQVVLSGYDLSTASPAAGDRLTFRPYWQAIQRPQQNYSMFVHLYPADHDEVKAQYDGAPVTPQRLTSTWDDPHELLIGPQVVLDLPPTLEPGSYRLVVGLYDFETGQRLLLPGGTDYVAIPVTVRASQP